MILEEYPDGTCKGMANGEEGFFPKAVLLKSDSGTDYIYRKGDSYLISNF